jgi:hypothetical protein
MRTPAILLFVLLVNASAPAQEHVHGEPGPAPRTEPPSASARGARALLRDEASALRAVRAAARSRDLDRLNRAVDEYAGVHRGLRAALVDADFTGDGGSGFAGKVSAAARESVANLRGLADASLPAFAESFDVAIAAAERTLGVASGVGGEGHDDAAPPRRGGGCGSGRSGHGEH